jgi:hypothetical protein
VLVVTGRYAYPRLSVYRPQEDGSLGRQSLSSNTQRRPRQHFQEAKARPATQGQLTKLSLAKLPVGFAKSDGLVFADEAAE